VNLIQIKENFCQWRLLIYWFDFAGARMCRRIRFLVFVAALTFATWSNSQAAGALRRPEPRPLVIAGIVPSLPSTSMPDVSAGDLVGGCGRGRVRDFQARVCRGPGRYQVSRSPEFGSTFSTNLPW
jgi:hypothetical protein